jgi:hypothetical protein
MNKVFDVPALLSIDLGAKVKEVEELFEVYHEIKPEQVTEIFLAFPYLYCCPSRRLQLFLAQFRKYRMTKD